MRRSLRRWLFQRREPQMKPLVLRTTWYDFAGRMRRAIAIDIAIETGELSRMEARALMQTRPLPRVEHDAPTMASLDYQFYADETMRVEIERIDQYATQPMEMAVR